MNVRTRWRVIVCDHCRQPIEAVLTATPYIPVFGLSHMVEDHYRAFGHWPNTRVTDAEQES